MKKCECCGREYDENAVYCPGCFALNKKQEMPESENAAPAPDNRAAVLSSAQKQAAAFGAVLPDEPPVLKTDKETVRSAEEARKVVGRAIEQHEKAEQNQKTQLNASRETGKLTPITEDMLPEDDEMPEKKSDKKERPSSEKKGGVLVPVLITVLCVLILALCVMIFLIKSGVISLGAEPMEPTSSDVPLFPEEKNDLEPVIIPCAGVHSSARELALKPGDSAELVISTEPQNCTDPVTVISLDDTVIRVNDDGSLLAVGEGTTQLLITCGKYGDTCAVTVAAASAQPEQEPTAQEPSEPETTKEPEQPTEPVTPPEPEKPAEMKLNYTDITLSRPREQVQLKVLNAGDAEVKWSCDNTVVLKVDETGLLTAMGTAQIVHVTAEVDGKTFSCIVRCNLGGKEGEAITVSLNFSDVTLTKIGEYFRLKLVYDEEPDEYPEVEWFTSDEKICTVDEKGTVRAVQKGTAYVYTFVDGYKLECIVRCNLPDPTNPPEP